jgi:hypothetical protein
MSKGVFFTYRFLGTFVSLIAYIAFFRALFILYSFGLSGSLALQLFVSACMIIYSVLSRLFSQVILKEGKPLRRSLKEWVIANAVVLIAGVVYGIYRWATQVLSPESQRSTMDVLAKFYADKPVKNVYTPEMVHSMAVMAVCMGAVIFSAGIVHAVWTLFLVKRYKNYFQ